MHPPRSEALLWSEKSGQREVDRRFTTVTAGFDIKGHCLTVVQPLDASAFHGRTAHEHVLAAIRRGGEWRQLFMAYVGLCQQLQAKPAFYNTITANCTTTVYELARMIEPDMPLDIRLIKSGRLRP